MLTKRRGQAKKAITDLVQAALNEYLEKMPSREEKYKLLRTVQEASEGKMFLEREYSNSTMALCKMLEEDGKRDEACKIIQEIQIETYGSLETKEKVEFILYQMHLVHHRHDFVRLQILSRKISKKHINTAGFEHQKLSFYHFMVLYFIHEKQHLEIAKAYQTVFDTLSTAPEELGLDVGGALRKTSFENFLIYLCLSPYSNEKVDLLNIVEKNY